MMKVWVIWISTEEQSSIAGVSSDLDHAMKHVESLSNGDLKYKHTQGDGTIEIRINQDCYIFLVPMIIDGDLASFDRQYYGLSDEPLPTEK